jgi:hypothetical protein
VRFGKKPQAKSLKPTFCPQKAGPKRKKHPKLERFSFNNNILSGADPDKLINNIRL